MKITDNTWRLLAEIAVSSADHNASLARRCREAGDIIRAKRCEARAKRQYQRAEQHIIDAIGA